MNQELILITKEIMLTFLKKKQEAEFLDKMENLKNRNQIMNQIKQVKQMK